MILAENKIQLDSKKNLFVTIWDIFENGTLLKKVLEDFYNNVYKSSVLIPYFSEVSKEVSIEKQYEFIYNTLTGKESKLYDFKLNENQPKLVPYDIINYRQNLMVKSFEKFNIPKYLINRIIEIEIRLVDEIINDKILGVSNYKVDLTNFKEIYQI